MKKIGIIIMGVLLAILLFVVSIKSIGGSIKNNKSNSNSVSSTQIVQENKKVVKSTEQAPVVTPIVTAKAEIEGADKGTTMSEEEILTMKELDLSTVPYSNKYSTESCTIVDKKAYYSENQIFYSLKIFIKSINKNLDYYVGYSTYNAFKVNAKVTVEYEKFDNGIVSITSIK